MKVVLFIVVLLFAVAQSIAQIDTVQLQEFTVQDCSITTPNAIQKQRITDSVLQVQPSFTLNNWLEQNSSFNLKTYGFGGVTSPSFRGTSAAHTNLIINGIEVNSPLIGFYDFNQTPIHVFGAIELVEGAGSIYSGGTGMGASVQFSTQAVQHNQFSVKQTVGSFGLLASQLDFKWKFKNNQTLRVNYWQRTAKNNFVFYNPLLVAEHEQIQQNSAITQRLAHLNYTFFIKKWKATFSAFAGKSTQEIPPSLTSSVSNQQQAIENVKGIFQVQRTHRKFNQKHSFAVLYDINEYTLQNAIDTNAFIAFKQSNEFRYAFSNVLSYSLVNFNAFTQTQVSSFQEAPQIAESKWIHSLQYTWKYFKLYGTIKQQLQSNFKNEWFLPALLIAYKKNVPLETSINFTTVYRAPTLNDLYWNPGGNSNLNPEKGYTTEWNLNYKRQNYSVRSSVFYSVLNESIQWQPTNLGYWQAANFGSIQIKGMSIVLAIDLLKTNHLKLSYSTSTTFSQTQLNDFQAIYSPQWVSSNWLKLRYKKLDLGYQVNYTSKRFINFENSWYLPYYVLHNAFIQMPFQVKNTQVTARLDGFNLLNANYYSVVYQPMPQRWFQVHVSVPFQLKSKHE